MQFVEQNIFVDFLHKYFVKYFVLDSYTVFLVQSADEAGIIYFVAESGFQII